jgi:hypothetical protein
MKLKDWLKNLKIVSKMKIKNILPFQGIGNSFIALFGFIKTYIVQIVVSISFILSFWFLVDSFNDAAKKYHYNDVQFTKVVKSIHVVNKSTNAFGRFKEAYYFCFTDGEIKEFDLKSYLNTKSGDTISWTETVVTYDE